MKFKENLIEVMKSAVVHCGTQEKAEALLKELAWHGVKWRHGEDLLFPDCQWEVNGIETCYTLIAPHGRSGLIFSCLQFCKVNGYKIIEFEDLLEEEKENDNNNNDNLVIKVNDIIHDLIDYANKKCEKTIHTAEAYRDGYIKGCKDSLGEVRAILSEFNNN